MSVGAGFARDDVFRPNRWLPKPETSYRLNPQLGVRKKASVKDRPNWLCLINYQIGIERELVALRRLGTVEDRAKVVEFLATDLSDYVTGVVIPIDGGLAGMMGVAFSGARLGFDIALGIQTEEVIAALAPPISPLASDWAACRSRRLTEARQVGFFAPARWILTLR